MTFTATVSTSVPPVLTVVSDFRKIAGTITATSNGQTATAPYSLVWPLTITDSSNHVWTLKSDDGNTAIFNY